MYNKHWGANVKGCLVTFLFLSCFGSSVNAELIFTAPPRENAEKANKLYGPLAEQLSNIIGERVIYEQPAGWFDYARNMRDGKYDIVFDGPHFAAWRVKNLKHIPIAALPGNLNFMLVTRKSAASIKSIRDLTGKRICGLLSPNLGTNLVYSSFKNPVLQPIIHEVKGGMKQVYQSFKNRKCDAAILRDAAYYRLPKKERAQLKILMKTKPLPNQTLTVSTRLKENANKIAQFMVSQDGAVAAENLLTRYSKKKKYFEKTSTTNYSGIEDLLEGVVFGW
jgi:ABC-type phosphate/phosphonate transport system substrate-binding protein